MKISIQEVIVFLLMLIANGLMVSAIHDATSRTNQIVFIALQMFALFLGMKLFQRCRRK